MKNLVAFTDHLQYTDKDTFEILTDTQILHAFCDSFVELRKFCGISLLKLSDEIGIPNQTLSSYENKTRTPSILQAIKIATFFGLTIEDFILCGLGKNNIIELYEPQNH